MKNNDAKSKIKIGIFSTCYSSVVYIFIAVSRCDLMKKVEYTGTIAMLLSIER